MSPQPAVCGRPTATGRPCRRPLNWYETACSVHQSPAEAEDAYQTLRAHQIAQTATQAR